MNITPLIDGSAEAGVRTVKRHRAASVQWQLNALREMPAAYNCCTPGEAAEYWKQCVATDERWTGETETLVVLILNTRKKIIGHVVCATGTLDTVMVCPRQVFRAALLANAAAIVLMHNHPSGDPTPSEGDIRVTRDIRRAGQLLKVELLDHVVMGTVSEQNERGWHSLRELGYFFE